MVKSGAALESAELYRPYSAVVTDSRKLQPDCLFVALKGEKFDGHDFIAEAIAGKARGVICRKEFADLYASDARLFAVDDTQVAYRKLGAAWRREFSIPLVAVAGSVGKTTSKELLTAILCGRWPQVLKTQGSQNGFVGIPMTLLELAPKHGAAVIEVGIDEIGAMQDHMQIVGANAAILTAIGPEHLEKLRDVPTVAHEEGLALQHVIGAGGLVAVNLDDPWIRPFSVTLRGGRKLAYSLSGTALPSQASGITEADVLRGSLSDDGRAMTVSGAGLNGLRVELPMLGKHNAMNLLGALALARGLGLNEGEIAAGLRTFVGSGAAGRSELRELPGGTPAVCDYYNANPTSVEAGLELLTQVAGTRSRWACLGDMLELGPDEESFHRGLALKISELRVENVLLYGQRMKWLQDELQKRGFGQSKWFESHHALAEHLKTEFKAGEALLIKGSRGMRMEEVWKLFEPYARDEFGPRAGGA
jgi:UDP-N-acetylmuramoyl-tripeptide--D-alanyl-D-alanine ligase